MRYISNTPAQQREMLARIGAGSIEDLLAGIPAKARLSRPLALPAAMAETDLVRHLRAMAARNAGADDYACFLGAGSYDHAIPSPINHLLSRGVNPLYRQVVETYCEGVDVRLRSAPLGDGVTDLEALRKAVSKQTAAVVVQYPNFFGD